LPGNQFGFLKKKRLMNILYLHQYFHTPKQVGGIRSYEFARRLVKAGHSVTMMTARDHSAPWTTGGWLHQHKVGDIDVTTLRAAYRDGRYGTTIPYFKRMMHFFQFAIVACWAVLRIPKHDVVFATSTPLTIGIPGVFASKVWRVPLVFEVRDLWPEGPIQMSALRHPALVALARWLERTIYRHSTHIVALSPGMAEGVRQTGIPDEKISVIPNASDLDIFRPGIDGSDFRTQLGLEGKFVCSYCGAMGEANDLTHVVRAAHLLQEQGDDEIMFVLCGQGKRRPNLEAYCREHGISNVLFWGPIPKQVVPHLAAASDVCMTMFKNLPVWDTSSPNKFFDSLAAGKPVLINFRGWLRDLIRQHEIGVCVEPDSAESIVEQVSYLRDHPELCVQYGKNARKLAKEQFSRDELATQLERVLVTAVQ
jgi:glycosyltransferase involved in cell wall biosynthesis